MRQLIAGNWKMHMLRGPATELATAVHAGAQGLACDLLMCPPFTAVEPVARVLAGSAVAVGGQDCHAKGQGAHTGDVSAAMLRDAGATWVILGHSERRQNHGETDELVREKVLAAVDAGLMPIVCVGETEDQRSSGQETEVVGWQIAGSLPKPFAGRMDPPYRMRIPAPGSPNWRTSSSRMKACIVATSCSVAVLPVPIAQHGS